MEIEPTIFPLSFLTVRFVTGFLLIACKTSSKIMFSFIDIDLLTFLVDFIIIDFALITLDRFISFIKSETYSSAGFSIIFWGSLSCTMRPSLRIAILSPGNDDEKIINIIKESLSKSVKDSFSVTDNLSVPLREARENFEKEYLVSQIKKFGGNISKTAKFVGMERSALHRKLKLLGVKDLN